VCFQIANGNEAPESWLEWPSFTWRKLVFGFSAHRRWHYTGPAGNPTRHVKWYIRSIGAPLPETIMNLWASFAAWVTCSEPPWSIDAREAAEQEEEEAVGKGTATDGFDTTAAASASVDTYDHKAVEAAHEAAAAASEPSPSRRKRFVTATGFIGVYICWAVFTWCAACAAFALRHCCRSSNALTAAPRTRPWPLPHLLCGRQVYLHMCVHNPHAQCLACANPRAC
jgi:hypothetical protein